MYLFIVQPNKLNVALIKRSVGNHPYFTMSDHHLISCCTCNEQFSRATAGHSWVVPLLWRWTSTSPETTFIFDEGSQLGLTTLINKLCFVGLLVKESEQ